MKKYLRRRVFLLSAYRGISQRVRLAYYFSELGITRHRVRRVRAGCLRFRRTLVGAYLASRPYPFGWVPSAAIIRRYTAAHILRRYGANST